MNISSVGLNLIKVQEGCILHAYKDAVGKPTIGIGHLIVDGDGFDMTSIITEQQALDLLAQDVQERVTQLNNALQVDVTQNQFDALMDFVYNLGVGALQSSTLLRVLNAGDPIEAANHFAQWDIAGGRVLSDLVKRRQAEHDLFVSGD